MRLGRAKLWVPSAAWIAVLLLSGPAAAAAQTSPAATTAQTVFRWLNFALVFGLGGWWSWRKLKGAFQRKSDRIGALIAEAEAARQAAQTRLREAEERLAALERESAEMRERARLDSVTEAAHIRDLAQEEARRIDRAAQSEIDAAELAAVNRLREMAIDRTIDHARERVSEQLTPEIDNRLVGRFVEALGQPGDAL